MLNLADMPIMQITEAEIEQWHLARRARKHAVACTRAYRLLSEIMIYANEKRAVIRNPVHIKGAGAETAPERETLTPDELVASGKNRAGFARPHACHAVESSISTSTDVNYRFSTRTFV